MKIQLLSDLHIEHFPDLVQFQAMYKERYGNELLEIPNDGSGDGSSSGDGRAHVLALAGDIGNVRKDGYGQFLSLASSLYGHVIVVAGNHELYGNEYYECMGKMKEICEGIENVHFLDRSSVEIVDEQTGEVYVFVGAILWSNIPEESQLIVESGMNDYRVIKIKENDEACLLRAKHTVKLFMQESEYIKQEIEKAKEKQHKVIVVSHNAPLNRGVSAPQFESIDNGPRHLNYAFATDLSSMMDDHVVAWMFGHTHYSSLQRFNNTIVASNQLGYLRGFSSEDKSFKQNWILDTNNLNLQSIPKFVPYPKQSTPSTQQGSSTINESSSASGSGSAFTKVMKFFKK